MATNWTKAQLHAMETQGRNLLVSAAAGSGKTATLTARIIRSLTAEKDPADISRLLVVTFTRAAAGELKTRITAALSSALAEQPTNKHLTKQLISIGSAAICTIDSFCLSLVREHFQSLSLPPDFRLADEAELAVMRRALMDDLIEEYYDNKTDGGFAALAEHFTGMRNDAELASILTELYIKVSAFPDGMNYFLRCAEQYEREADLPFFQTQFGGILKAQLSDRLNSLCAIMEEANDLIRDGGVVEKSYGRPFSHDLSVCHSLRDALAADDYEAIRREIAAYQPIRLPALSAAKKTEDSIRACELRKQAVAELREKVAPQVRLSQEKLPALFRATAKVCYELYEFLSDYDGRLTQEKLSRAVCDFGDITRLSYRLLVNPQDGSPTEVAREIADRFDTIYIDEYQDVNAVQDAIFRAIAKPNNRYMVGDIKQSIYGFRGAEPSIFADYRKAYPAYGVDSTDDPAQLSESIFMSENFRCDKHVIDFTNTVCSYLFSACGESIGYVSQDDLIFSKKCPEEQLPSKVQVMITVPDREEKKAPAPDTAEQEEGNETKPEIRLIVGEICHLLKNGSKADGTPIRPSDIAILTRTATCHQDIADALQAAGIATATAEQKDFFENPEVLLLLCLLNTIDNPTRDIPLAGTLRSPLFGFTMDDLIRIRKLTADCPLIDALRAMSEQTEEDPLVLRCQSFLRLLDGYRDAARAMPVDRLLRRLYRETCILAYVGSGDRAASQNGRTNLMRFYEYARRFESGSFKGLYQFISYINGIIEEGTKIEFGGSAAPDAVSIMTIHKSKGLEFPVCFISNTLSAFSDKDSKPSLLLDRRMGLALRLPDESGFARLNTPMRQALIAYKADQLREEELRLLYVALTRARERLYVTANSRSYRETLLDNAHWRAQRKEGLRTALMDCRSYMDWILTALDDGRGDSCCDLHILTPSMLDDYLARCAHPVCDDSLPADTESADMGTAADSDRVSFWDGRFRFRYPYEHLTVLPSKISISDLHPGVLDERISMEEEDLRFAEEDTALRLRIAGGALPDDHIGSMVDKWLSRTPAFCQPDAQKTVSAAERGTATHLFLQFCDMEHAAKHGVAAEAARLTEKKFLPPHIAEQIRTEQLSRFFRSNFFHRLSGARRVWREQRFQLLLPASDFTEHSELAKELSGEWLLVQGVIDLFFETEDGKLILCDYKTDALTVEELRDPRLAAEKLTRRHARQLTYYAKALRQLCGRTPDEVVIYSLPLGDTVRMEI
ncbi:MAG: helicase-exonuclease AddAB subunit AddA [Clostridia bacterium]|nr:helicase-exonuclease AddAB subunit AddA [Clostridia bacterium]